MDHDSAVPAQMFFLPEACSTSHFILPPLYCLCTLHLSCDSLLLTNVNSDTGGLIIAFYNFFNFLVKYS